MITPLEERFWAKVEKTDGCWEWRGGKTTAGYGHIFIKRSPKRVVEYSHRLSYVWAKGPIPDGLEIDHLCHNRACVNPAHMEAVTHVENMRRSAPKGYGEFQHKKTHCPQGHPYDQDNTKITRGGRGRACRICARASFRVWWHRRRSS